LPPCRNVSRDQDPYRKFLRALERIILPHLGIRTRGTLAARNSMQKSRVLGGVSLLWLGVAIAICLAPAQAWAAGVQFIDVPADGKHPRLAGVVWYPCSAPAEEVRLRSLKISAVKDCPVVGDRLPLIVISHGRGAWFGGHHDTAAALANAGLVTVAINHPGENAFDKSRIDELFFFALGRPVDTKRLIDFMLNAWPNAPKLDRERIGHFGFSRGGYTTLAVIGGMPDPRRGAGRCPRDLNIEQCELFRKSEVVPDRTLTHDARIKAAVIADPGPTFLFGPGDLDGIRIPVQLWSSGLGGRDVTPEGVAAIRRALPPATDYRIVENAGHFAFLAPCSAEQAQSIPEICTDAVGFDRVAFHKSFNAEVVRFFRTHLIGRP
jgi:predicted dienelactone hydrolase